ncbi:MAG: DUF2400 family protein [Bdellovibrionota bacterium]
MDGAKIKRELESLYKKYHRPELLGEDPLGHVSNSLSPEDFELVSYVSASLSYGRVEQIKKSLSSLWIRIEKVSSDRKPKSLHALFVDNSWKVLENDFRLSLKGWVHRFNDEKDILILLKTLHRVVHSGLSLGELYAQELSSDPTQKLESFVQRLRAHAEKKDQKLLRWFACAPSEGSTCKRLVMWLRWMLRSDEIDPGIWVKSSKLKNKGIGAHLAFIPMDTHIHRWATERRLLSTKAPSWKAVEELTSFLRKVDPLDPARFDFCICHHGMSEFRKKNPAKQKKLNVATRSL